MKEHRRRSLLSRLTVMFSVIILLGCAVICVYTYRIEMNQQLEECYNTNIVMLRTLGQEMDNTLAQVEILTQELAYDPDVTRIFREQNLNRFIIDLMFKAQRRVEISESHLTGLNADVLLVRPDDKMPERYGLCVNASYMANRLDYIDFLQSGQSVGWSSAMRADARTISYFHSVYSAYSGMQPSIGVVMCSINTDRLFQILQGVEGILVMDGEALAYSHDGATPPPPQGLRSDSLQSENVFYVAQPLERSGYTLTIGTAMQPLRAQALHNALMNMAVVLLTGLVLLAAVHYQVRNMLSHLEMTRRAVLDLSEDADLAARLPDHWNDEAGDLAAAFKRLNSRVNEYYHRLLQEEKDKRRAQQIALQYQLNPHFLFNSLYWLQLQLEEREVDEALSDAIAQLGQVLHYNLDEHFTATLAAEKQMARSYVSFMSGMKGSPITLQVELPHALETQSVPRFTLQPLLENAIQHGFIKDKPLHLTVSFSQQFAEGMLCIRVMNDGKPIDPQRQEELNAYLAQPQPASAERGVGLSNIRRRLMLFYGECVSLRVASDVNCTSVTILLPITKEKGQSVHEGTDR